MYLFALTASVQQIRLSHAHSKILIMPTLLKENPRPMNRTVGWGYDACRAFRVRPDSGRDTEFEGSSILAVSYFSRKSKRCHCTMRLTTWYARHIDDVLHGWACTAPIHFMHGPLAARFQLMIFLYIQKDKRPKNFIQSCFILSNLWTLQQDEVDENIELAFVRKNA